MNEHTSHALNIASSAERLSLLPPKGSGPLFVPRAAWQAGHLHVLRAAGSHRVLCLGAPSQGTQEDRHIQGAQQGVTVRKTRITAKTLAGGVFRRQGDEKARAREGQAPNQDHQLRGGGTETTGPWSWAHPAHPPGHRLGEELEVPARGGCGPGVPRSANGGSDNRDAFCHCLGARSPRPGAVFPPDSSGEGPPSPHQPLATWFPAAGPLSPCSTPPFESDSTWTQLWAWGTQASLPPLN